MIYPENFEYKLGFNNIREKLKGNALSELGQSRVDEMRFITQAGTIRAELEQTSEFWQIQQTEENFPLEYFMDMREALERIRVEGAYMETAELFNLLRSLKTIRAIVNFLKKKYNEDESYPELHRLAREVTIYPFVFERIGNILNSHGEMKDNASPELRDIRSQLREKEAKLSSTAHQILNQAKKDQVIDKETSLTIREGKMLIPVSAAHKRKIQGYVHDESASGKTAFIEPVQLFNMNNAIRELQFEEKREIVKILRKLADDLRPYMEDLRAGYEFLADIDFIQAKALLSQQMDAVKPKITAERTTDLRYARHPLLYMHFKRENREVVPLSMELDAENRILVISGPNAGGKSVCLQTVGLIQYMMQCGLLVPATDQSHMGIYSNIFVDMGDDQSIDNDLSTYSSHLSHMKHFLEHASEETMVLIDELGTGTEPVMGGAIAEAVLENLNNKGAMGVVTTHYTNLKHFATQTEGLLNGAMLFDNDNMEPLFQLEVGKPGSSFAFEIANKIGLSNELIAQAKSKAGQEHVDFDKNLREIENEKRKFSDLNKSLKLKEKELDEKLDRYDEETRKTLEKRKNIVELSREEAKDILQSANKTIENTIAEIRRVQAEKEQTRKIRQDFEDKRKRQLQKNEENQKKIEDKIRKIKEKQARKAERKQQTPEKGGQAPTEAPVAQKRPPVDDTIRPGDAVRIKNQDAVAEVLEVDDDQAALAFGSMQMTVNTKRLEKTGQNQLRKNEVTGQVHMNEAQAGEKKSKGDFLFGLDVRGKRAQEAVEKVEHYLDEAVMSEAPQIRILHGTGTGALRQSIREYLGTHDLVRRYYDERVDQGGAGITIVELDV